MPDYITKGVIVMKKIVLIFNDNDNYDPADNHTDFLWIMEDLIIVRTTFNRLRN